MGAVCPPASMRVGFAGGQPEAPHEALRGTALSAADSPHS